MLSLVLFLAAAPIVDVENHAVSFNAVSTDCGLDADMEFFFVGPESDHDYESMFYTENSPKELADAFAKAGIPLGSPMDYGKCRFWPVGGVVTIEPDIWSLVRDLRNERKAPILYTGGKRNPDSTLDAQVAMPQAVFALYGCAQSLMQFDDSLPQSDTYGRFRPAVKIPRGEVRKFTVKWKGASLIEKAELKLEPGNLASAIAELRKKCEGDVELDVTTVFSPELTVEEAKNIALALQTLDSFKVKLNGFADGQFFYRAFLPLERWRDRSERLTQPYEVRIDAAGKPSLTVIKEDWSSNGDSLDPVLVVKENVDFSSLAKEGSATVDTCLVFAPKTSKLADVFAVRRLLPPNVVNFYVYGE